MLRVFGLLMFFQVAAAASLSPFGVILGDSTPRAVQAKYRVRAGGIDSISDSQYLDLMASSLAVKGLVAVRVLFDGKAHAAAVLTSFENKQWPLIHRLLRDKYSLIAKHVAADGAITLALTAGASGEVYLVKAANAADFSLNYVSRPLMRYYRPTTIKKPPRISSPLKRLL